MFKMLSGGMEDIKKSHNELLEMKTVMCKMKIYTGWE